VAVKRTGLGLLREHYFAPDYPANLIQNPETARRLQRFFGLRERMPVQSVAPDVQPVVVVSSLEADPTSTTRRCASADVVGAVVGESGAVELQNGDLGSFFVDTGVDLILRRVIASNSVAGLVIGQLDNGEAGFLSTGTRFFLNTGLGRRDLNILAQPRPAGLVKDGTSPGIGALDQKVFTALLPAATAFIIDEPGVIIEPGWCFRLVGNPSNSIFHYSLLWDERPRVPDRP